MADPVEPRPEPEALRPAAEGRPSEQDEELRALARLLGAGGTRGTGTGRARNGGSAPRPRAAPARGRFELLRALDPTPQGEAFLARDTERAGRLVRLLRLRPELSERPGAAELLEDLGRRLASLTETTPALRSAREWLVTRGADGRLEVASAPLEGESLRALLARRGTLPPRHALEIARQILLQLEPAHARGLVHGDLAASRVGLESRVPWNERNPFGVGVRLLDHGLAARLAPAGASPARDLEAVAALLVEMQSGTRLEPGAGLAGVLTPALRAGGVGRLLQRALGAGPAFPDAAAFRAALERTRAWRGGTRGLRGLAGLAGLLALLFAGLWRHERGVRAAERVRLESEQRMAREDAALPAAALALDRFLGFLEEGERRAAADVLAAARATSSLAGLGFDTNYLEDTLALREALDAAGRAAEPLERARGLLEARAIAARARLERERFLLAGARWLTAGLPPRPAREADCLRWHAHLEQELAQRSAALAEALEARWNTLTASEADDPDEVRLLARWFGDARVSAYATRLPLQAALLRDELLSLSGGLVFGPQPGR